MTGTITDIGARSSGAKRQWTWPRVLIVAGWLLMATMLFHVAALALSGGAVTGPVSLRKPATFAETSWLLCWSVALVLPWLDVRGWRRHLAGVSVLAFGFGETAIMAIQAWRGVPSHYNFTTAFDAILMRGGAAGLAGLLLVGLVVLLAATGRAHEVPRSVRLGIRAGLGVLIVGCVIGFVMISNMSGVFQGAFGAGFTHGQSGYMGPSPAVVGHEYLLLRPYTDGGDLVGLHAIGVHGLPLLTLPALLLARTRLPEGIRLRYVRTMAYAVAAGIVLLGVHAFRQLPLADLGVVEVGVLAALALTYATILVACGVAWLRDRRQSADDSQPMPHGR